MTKQGRTLTTRADACPTNRRTPVILRLALASREDLLLLIVVYFVVLFLILLFLVESVDFGVNEIVSSHAFATFPVILRATCCP